MSKINKGKVRAPILIIGLAVIAFFIFVGWERDYNPLSGLSSEEISSITITRGSSTAITLPTTSTPPVTVVSPALAGDGHSVGIAAGGGLSKVPSSTLNIELNQMEAMGVQWVRFDIEWGDVQYSSPNDANWYAYDSLVQALAAHHLKGLGIILFTPQWARSSTCYNGVECPPANPQTFATFAAEVAARYKSYGMHYWEIWNEPNNYNFWAPKTDCVGYANLLKAVYPAIKQADPQAVVVTGGLAPETTDGNNTSPTDFLSCLYNNGAGGYFDAVGDHPYSFPQFPSQVTSGAWAQMSETTPSLRSIMIGNGDANKKIWITEYGTPTNGPDPNWYVSEAQESQMMTDAFSLYKTYSWAGPFFWYTFEDGGTSTSTNENFFGLIRADGTTKPAYTTLQNIISAGL
jgi:polysaccharide biosynthesis protein PslG